MGMYAHFPAHELRAFLVDGPGIGQFFAYVCITALACMAYGALFVWLGIRYKNPIIPAVSLLFWESANIFLPTWLKKFSILYYLRSLTPVDAAYSGPAALFGGVADPVSAPVAVLSLVAISAVLIVLATGIFADQKSAIVRTNFLTMDGVNPDVTVLAAIHFQRILNCSLQFPVRCR